MSEPIIIGDLEIAERKAVPEPVPKGMVVVKGRQVRVRDYVLITKRLALDKYNEYPELKDRAPVQSFFSGSMRMHRFGSLAEAAAHKFVHLHNIDCIPMAILAEPMPVRQGKTQLFYPLPKEHRAEFKRLLDRAEAIAGRRPPQKQTVKAPQSLILA